MELAILMAAGMGTRMRPLTDHKPKPLICVGQKPMIETIIDSLEKRKIEKIIVVVGYLGEQFSYLEQKYNNVLIIKNDRYNTVNNISSIYASKEFLLEGDCFICEADLFVSDTSIFDVQLSKSCYYGKMVKGHSDDWVFNLNEAGIITRVGKGGDNLYNMTGIAYFKDNDAKTLYRAISSDWGKFGYEKMFWDDVVDNHIDEFNLTIHSVNHDQIIEIDTVDELELVRKEFNIL